MRLALLAVPAALLLVAPAVVSSTPPTITTRYSTPEVQKLLDAALQNEQVKGAFTDGKTVTIRESGGRAGHDAWSGTAQGGAVRLQPGAIPDANVQVTIDSKALFNIVNAYDPQNSALLALQRHFITVKTDDAAAQVAINGLQKTPAAGELGRAPAAGDAIGYQGCIGNLASDGAEGLSGQFVSLLCDRFFLVSDLGGVVGRLPTGMLAPFPPSEDTSRLTGLSTGANAQVAGACTATYTSSSLALPDFIRISAINRCIAETLGVNG